MVVGRRSSWRALQVAVSALCLVAGLAGVPTGASAQPENASNCSGSVCEYVQGSGTQVSDWETTAYASSATCTYANFWVNYVLARQSARRCVAAGTPLRSDWKDTSFPAGTVLCNTWANIAGQPCVTVKG